MKELFLKDIQAGGVTTAFAVVARKDTLQTKAGKPYLAVTLRDRTGEMEARIWDDCDALGEGWDVANCVKIQAEASVYEGSIQLKITRIRKAFDEEIDLADYLPCSPRNAAAEYDRISERIGEIHDVDLRNVCVDVWDRYRDLLLKAPAAQKIHHATVGGLLEHIGNLINAADALVPAVYPNLDSDLLIVAAVWHDIGKVAELSVGLTFEYSIRGSLCGHVPIGLAFLTRAAERCDLPPEKYLLVEHLIVSHHGKAEFGAIRPPAIPEAILFHYLDEMDAKVEAARAALAGEVDANGMTPWSKALETRLYRRTSE